MRFFVTEYNKTIETNLTATEIVKRFSQHVDTSQKWSERIWPLENAKQYQGKISESTLRLYSADKSEINVEIYSQLNRTVVELKVKPMPTGIYSSNSVLSLVFGFGAGFVFFLIWVTTTFSPKPAFKCIFASVYAVLACYPVWLYNKYYEKSMRDNADKIIADIISQLNNRESRVLKHENRVPEVNIAKLATNTLIAGAIATAVLFFTLVISGILNYHWLDNLPFGVYPFGSVVVGILVYLFSFGVVLYVKKKKTPRE